MQTNKQTKTSSQIHRTDLGEDSQNVQTSSYKIKSYTINK